MQLGLIPGLQTGWFCLTRYVKGHRNSEALGTDVIGALKWYFHIRRPVRGTALGTVVDDELVSVHWEGSIKLFMKVPFDGDIMRPTYMVEGFTQKASAELGMSCRLLLIE